MGGVHYFLSLTASYASCYNLRPKRKVEKDADQKSFIQRLKKIKKEAQKERLHAV
jgi:hypothetical protein